MGSAMRKLTNCTDETTIQNLFSGDLVFGIPYFQRAYKWTDKNVDRFTNDLNNLLDYEDTSHFLGAVIIYQKTTSPSDPNYYQVIDGQQRLTTLFLALIALAKVFTNHEMYSEALGLYQKYLVITRPTPNITNSKLISCKEDRSGINKVFEDLFSNSLFLQKLVLFGDGYKYKFMQNSGNPKGRVWKNYNILCKFFEMKYNEGVKTGHDMGKRVLNDLYTKLVSNMSVVQIVVTNPTDGPKIFDSLNSKQHPMTIGDLVRNEIFSKYAGEDDNEIDSLDVNFWHPFYERFKQDNNDAFDKVFEDYFFPYVLTLDHTIKKADAFNYLREKWASKQDPKDIITDLKEYQDIFIDLRYGTSLTNCHKDLKLAMHNLARMDTPTSVYPFIMHVIKGAENNIISVQNAAEILSYIESFLVRRVVCGYEPTGLHAAFKALWSDCAGDYSVENVVKNIKRHYTVKWPADEEFVSNIKTRKLYRVRMTPYILAEWNGNLGGDIPELISEQIEHVLPSNPDVNSQWNKDWSKEQQEEKRDCLANLLPLSGPLNSSIQNSDYSIKRDKYINDSALKAPRDFGNKYSTWTPKDFEDRAEEMAKWAVSRWKY